jgi:hypothetical protein
VIDTEPGRIQVLDRLYDFRPDNPAEMADISVMLNHSDVDPQDQVAWMDLLRGLDADGLITLSPALSFEGFAAVIKGPGRAEVEARRRRRADTGLRRRCARDAVIQWISGHPRHPTTDMPNAGLAHFEGAPFTPGDVADALQYLDEKDLIDVLRGDDTVMTAWLTAAGQDCVDLFGGSVGEYVRGDERGGTVNNVNFHGTVSGNVGWQNQTLTQTASTTGFAGDELRLIVQALRQAAPTLGLPEADAHDLDRHLTAVEDELEQAEPSKEVTTTFMHRALNVVEKQAESALGLVLTTYLKMKLQEMGMLPS